MIDSIKKAGARYPIDTGDLVIWEEDPRYITTYHLWVVMGHARGPNDYPRKILRPISTADNKHRFMRKIIGAASELVPISAFGVEVELFRRDPWGGFLKLRRNASMVATATDSRGRRIEWKKDHPAFDGVNWTTSVSEDVADIVGKRIAQTGLRSAT